ncbi:MAG: enoyl-CoA hydratase/isomerase family protein [Clostridia bacterium]|nr:enoyl-CoA hydratase/isomerase family protein [Clostridia bacterium]
MSFHSLLFEVESGIATITLNRPERLNVLDLEALGELTAAFATCRQRDDVRVVTLFGSGRAFCAGGDLRGTWRQPVPYQRRFAEAMSRLYLEMRDLGKPIIAGVQGLAVAGGTALAASCDIVLATPDARFGATEIRVGVWPSLLMAVLLHLLPKKVVLDLCLTGRLVEAEEAVRIGLVTQVVPTERLREAVRERAEAVCALSPEVVRLGRDGYYAMQDMPFHDAIRYAREMYALMYSLEDVHEGIDAFLHKRAPQWRGR